jgi:tRNA G26 N,N-dimethylase Trm1
MLKVWLDNASQEKMKFDSIEHDNDSIRISYLKNLEYELKKGLHSDKVYKKPKLVKTVVEAEKTVRKVSAFQAFLSHVNQATAQEQEEIFGSELSKDFTEKMKMISKTWKNDVKDKSKYQEMAAKMETNALEKKAEYEKKVKGIKEEVEAKMKEWSKK